MRGSVARGIGLALIALAATVPFLGKAFHIDDPLYLAVARQIIAEPLDPYGADILWERSYESLFDADFNPPLWSYVLAPVLAVCGEPEVQVTAAGETEQGSTMYRAEPASRLPEMALHGIEAAFMAVAIAALYVLSGRYVRWPMAATALVALSPALLPGQNVMLEGPVLAFWFTSLACYLRGVERADWRLLFAAGAFATLAVLTKYTSGLLLVLIVLDLVRRRRWQYLSILCLPVAALAVWSVHNWLVYERLHILVIFSRAQTGGREPVGVRLFETWGRSLAVFRAVGATTALAIPIFVVVWRRFGFWPTVSLVSLAFGLAWLGKVDMAIRLMERDGRPMREVFPELIPAHVLAFGTLGAMTAVGLMAASVRRARHATIADDSYHRDELFLWLWVGLVLAFGVLATPFLAIRHLLPGLPPLVWLVIRRLDETSAIAGRRDPFAVLGITVTVSAAAGFLVAKADYDFANWYRHLALDVASRTVAAGRDDGKTVWYTGHWGWAYYAERVGMRPYIAGETQMAPGDFLLLPQVQTWQLPPKELYRNLKGKMRPIPPVPRTPELTGIGSIDRAVHWTVSGVRSITNEVHFYGPGTLTVPWRFSHRPLDLFNVIEVQEDVASSEGD